MDLNSATPASPYTTWATAAKRIQDAVDAAVNGDDIIVTNGVYATGGRVMYGGMTNRLAINKAVTVRSVNGPLLTVIQGTGVASGATNNGVGAIRCTYVGTNAVLSGFTLTNGHTLTGADTIREESGGGVWCEPSGVVSNCTLSGNSAYYDAGGAFSGTLNNCILNANSALGGYSSGGATAYGTLNDCTLRSNSAAYNGGGAFYGTLSNCTLNGNSAGGFYGYGGATYGSTLINCNLSNNWSSYYGGGAYQATLTNCTLRGNWATNQGGGAYGSTLSGCTLSGNSALYGGGAYSSTLSNCTLNANSANGYLSSGGAAYGGTLNNCMVIGNLSTEWGGGVYSSTNNNCTLTGNSAYEGGATYYGTLNNCILSNNSASLGGGANSSTLNNCILFANSAAYGGGAQDSTLSNCTVCGNTASPGYGGGAYGGILNNCIVYYNLAPYGPNYYSTTLNNSCTSPLPSGGSGNIASEPLLVSTNGWANLRLRSNSPCIDSGSNAYAPGLTDLDGRPRVVGGIVDMGAYEFQSGISGVFIGWLQQYGLPTDGSADYTDADGDGMNNWQEWIAGTNPTNTLSVLQMVSATPIATNVVVTWSSVNTRAYSLARATNLQAPPAFSMAWSNIAGQAGTTSFMDTNPPAGASFYRVAVQPP
ncbi:MAG: hypothetical protein C5B50_23350 [Verrucomicrobia bacterium]|nr:MAG: hypothetical protein C5B50_23350 [Verrucomicrobiota bacterium]